MFNIHYEPLAMVSSLDLETLISVKEESFDDLLKNTNQQLAYKNYENAVSFATKATLLYGLPGLLIYLKAMLAFQKDQKEKGNLSEQKVFDNMTLVFLAKKLADHDLYAQEMMQKFLPQGMDTDVDYIQAFVELRSDEFKNYVKEAEAAGNKLFELCLKDQKSHGFQP